MKASQSSQSSRLMEGTQDMSQKRPLSAYFLYVQSEVRKGPKQSQKVMAKAWQELTEDEKRPYFDEYMKAKQKHDEYVEADSGLPPRAPVKPKCYNVSAVRAVCTSQQILPPVETRIYRALGRVLVFCVRIFRRHLWENSAPRSRAL